MQNGVESVKDYPIDPKTGLRNSPNAGYLISCGDSGGSSMNLSTDQLQTMFAQYEEVSEFFGGVSLQFALICTGANLPSGQRYTGHFGNITTANPILFVGNTADPTTPIHNARSMSAIFDGSGILTIEGTGQLSYNAVQDIDCPSRWISSYFQNGTLPPRGTVCHGKQMRLG